ncbi:unnamed protein product [Trifolium pratense]|uniref:Uncharacterized protein n=1 Tax=Trifolium pratense TaxID=57577 RepID=A0ACB0KRV5_TRIPR|nr:unnamed protein product [Trifolium pratense]
MHKLEFESQTLRLSTFNHKNLNGIISNDETQNHYHQKISQFHGLTRPDISIQSYLERIFKYANCSSSCIIVAYVYLHRFTQSQPSLPINSFNVHRLLITSVMVAAKFMDDVCYNNTYYAKVGGITETEMIFLESWRNHQNRMNTTGLKCERFSISSHVVCIFLSTERGKMSFWKTFKNYVLKTPEIMDYALVDSEGRIWFRHNHHRSYAETEPALVC